MEEILDLAKARERREREAEYRAMGPHMLAQYNSIRQRMEGIRIDRGAVVAGQRGAAERVLARLYLEVPGLGQHAAVVERVLSEEFGECAA